MTYVRYNADTTIAASATWPAPDMVKVDFEVVRGYDGKLYEKGKEPVKPQEEVEAEAFAALRAERDKRLADTDYLIMPDYPIAKADLKAVKAYRQALRDLPAQEGAPWIDATIPWPVKPGEEPEVEETEEVIEADIPTEPDTEGDDA